VVRIALPEITGQASTVAPATYGGDLRGHGEVVLLVEDEDLVRQLAVDMLRELGYDVIAAADAESALALAAGAARIDALLTDVILPTMNGRELAERLQQDRPSLRVLYTSGYSEKVVTERGRIAPGLRFVPKPYTRTQLAQALREVLS
jgi:CheY-like chemotaxis protein